MMGASDYGDNNRCHLIKLAAGCPSLEALEQRQDARLAVSGELFHRTRMMPRRQSDLLAGGSIYWVIRGQVLARQRLLELRPVIEEDGRSATHLILDRQLVPVRPRAQKAFQGWRYLAPEDAPDDLPGEEGQGGLSGVAAMPATMRAELAELGLL